MIKQGGLWNAVDWQTALEYVANGLKQIGSEFGAQSIGALVSPHATLEELHLSVKLMQGLGSPNVDYRLRNAEHSVVEGVRYLGTSIASLSDLQSVLVIGSSLRKDHPLFAQRIRQATRKACVVSSISTGSEDWAMPVAHRVQAPASRWLHTLVAIGAAVGSEKSVLPPVTSEFDSTSLSIARSLLKGERKAILLGNGAAHHADASTLLAIAQWIGDQTGATVGYLTEAANTVGAQLVGAVPDAGGMNAEQMLRGSLKAVLLLGNEPEFDSLVGADACELLS
jgi:NADH-quinone oxidoreductase subunit G